MLNLTCVLGYLWFGVSSCTELFSIPFRIADRGLVFKMANLNYLFQKIADVSLNLVRGNQERGHFSHSWSSASPSAHTNHDRYKNIHRMTEILLHEQTEPIKKENISLLFQMHYCIDQVQIDCATALPAFPKNMFWFVYSCVLST